MYTYGFDISFAALNTTLSLYGLSRFSKHQDELNVIYGINAVVGGLLLARAIRITSERGIFRIPYYEVKRIRNIRLREKIAEYRLMEISNSVRQLRRITGYFGLISAAFNLLTADTLYGRI